MAESSKNSATKGESAPAAIKATNPLEKGKRQPEDDSETKVDLKKQKKDVFISEMKEMMEGFADRLQRLEAKVDLLATKADLEAILILAKGKKVPAGPTSNGEGTYMETSSSDDEVTATKKLDAAAKNVSLKVKIQNPSAKDYASSGGGNGQTISVTGFESWLPVDYIKTELIKYFGSFGEITRVFVPADPVTGISLGYAYIDLKEGAEKALELGVIYMQGGGYLVIGKAEPIRSGSTWPYPGRCGSQGHCRMC